ncbi:hypothetical protein OD350_29265 (plasmid) [Clostridium beijerinckii]|uniref:hypothetical protein n=1 Tax=Clostridium beijerinckii TaxID=1520 RepID=UPI002227FCBD|nr:hypothetical protein [Clostridium beijerinckii]UYZ38979.1 hypothetical protein OD350_29265 [Clostridium beijerinckii]
MKKLKKKSSKKRVISSAIVLLFTTIILTGTLWTNASKIARADINTIDNLQHQIETLSGLNYSPKDIRKIIEMTNKDVSFYIVNYSDRIVIGLLNAKDEPEDIREIKINNSNN